MRSADPRLAAILDALQDIASGDLQRRLEISSAHDEIDAIAHAINVVGGELDFTTRRLQRARDEAERSSEAKTVFLRNISHDLRTPLSAVLGMAQLLQLPQLDTARRNDLYARIIANVRAQAELLDDLLDLSQVESGRLTIECVPMSLAPMLAEVISSVEISARHKGLQILLDPPSELTVNADRKRLRQILVNIIGNAIKFTSQGAISVRAGSEGADVIVDVADTGIGIHPEHAERLFELFTQADASIAPRFGGSGLGLALARALARQMEGEITIVATALGTGTTFRLRLPRWQGPSANADDQAASASAIARGERLLDGICVLVVDDQEDVRTPLVSLLVSRGATVVEAENGREAIERGLRPGLDVVLMDVRMPDISGLEATRRLRDLLVATPIIAVTADVVATHRKDYLDAGFTAHLAKPVEIEGLIALIHGVVGQRASVA